MKIPVTPQLLQKLKHRPMGLPEMQDAWLDCVAWAFESAEQRDLYYAHSGVNLEKILLHRSPIERQIDETTGFQDIIIIGFIDWVTEYIWGIAK